MAASYFAPTALDEAVRLLQSGATIVAGGTDFFPARGRRPITQDIVDVTGLPELAGLTWTADGGLRIGGAVTWSQIATADLAPAFAGLQAAARLVGSLQIQNAGTIAGNICNASPAADGIPPLLALDAEVELTGPSGPRRLALQDFILGVRKIDLGAGELVVAIHIPQVPAHTRAAFEKAGSRTYLVISIIMTSVLIGLDDQGRIDVARIAVGACSPVAQRLTQLEHDLIGKRLDQVAVTQAHLAPLSPIEDVRADPDYRYEAAREQILRAIQIAGATDE